MKDFLNKTWVKITSWVLIIIGTLVLILGGTGADEIAKVPAMVAGILQAIGILIAFIRGMIALKDADKKKETKEVESTENAK